jgi:ABC-type Mn2+/Zn2+ transport system permease subunit
VALLPARYQPGYTKRMRTLAPQIVRLLNLVAFQSPSWCDNIRLLDSTPVPCGASRETVKRSGFVAGRGERLGGDVGVAVAISVLFGLGAMLALSPEVPPRLGELLFGDLLGVTWRNLVEAAVLAGGVALALGLAHRRLALSVFDRAAAPSLGARPARWELAPLALLAVCSVAAMLGLGNLLVVALILAPGAAALNVARRLPTALALSATMAAAAGVLGLPASYHWEVAAGASVALAGV